MPLARRVIELAESATLAVSAKAARLRAEGHDVIGFGAGEPDFPTPAPIRHAATVALDEGHTSYSKPASGLAPAKQAVCIKFQRDNGLAYTPKQTIITAGGKMTCYLAVQSLVNPGDEVIIPKPYWVSYPEIVKLAGGVPVFVCGPEDNDYKLTPEVLDRAITPQTKLVFLNSPSNPSGVTYAPDEIRALAATLEDRPVTVISDEIYDRLLYDGQRALSYAAVSEKAYAQTITINAASKTYAMTGWRLGYAGGPSEIISGMAKLQSQSTSGAVTFNQYALVEALTGDQAPVEAMRVEFERRGKHMWERLCAIPGVRCPRPTGAFYCFPNIAEAMKKLGIDGSGAFAERLLDEAKVAVVPGVAFGLDEHVRLSFASSMTQIGEGLDRIQKFLS